MARVRHKTIGVLAAFGLLAASLMPQEHVHFSRVHDHDHSDVVHRHYEAHHAEDANPAFEQTDDEIQWLTASFTRPQTTSHTYPLHQLSVDPAPCRPPMPTWTRAARVERATGQGPPWSSASGLRAPPSFDLI